MKIETFQTLLAIIETGSMAKAAHSLGLTPSAVSMQIKQLEEYMGAALFDRAGQAIRPHPLALELAGVVDGCLQKVQALRQRRDIQVKGVVRLGVVDTLLPFFLPRTLAQLQSQHPQLEVRASRGKSKWLQQQVQAGNLDVAVLAQPEGTPPGRSLHWQPLMERDFVLLAPPGSTGTVAALLRQHKVIAYDRTTTTGRMASAYLSRVHGLRKPHMEFDSIPSIISMVGLGMGVSVLQIADPRLLQADAVRVLPLGRSVPRIQYAALTRQDVRDKRNVQALLLVLQLLGQAQA